MRIGIIDSQDVRRRLADSWLKWAGYEVDASKKRKDLHTDLRSFDLILLHVGVNQEQFDNVEGIIAEFKTSLWMVGYSGGAIVRAAMHDDAKFARYRPQVAGDDFPLGLQNTLAKVLAEMSGQGQLDEQKFRSIVTKFDQILEYKLQALTAVLEGTTIGKRELQELYKVRPDAIDLEKSDLRMVPGDRVASAKLLRDLFFGSSDQ